MATAGFQRYGKATRRATFLCGDGSWGAMAPAGRLIEPVYGRPPLGVERMLRIYFFQH